VAIIGRVCGLVLSQITNDFLADRRITAAIFNWDLVNGDVSNLIGRVVAGPGGPDVVNLRTLGIILPLEVGGARLDGGDLLIDALVGRRDRPIRRLLSDRLHGDIWLDSACRSVARGILGDGSRDNRRLGA